MAVLSGIDLLWVSPENFDTGVLEPKGDVLGELTCVPLIR